MSNFDYLKHINRELSEIGSKLESDVVSSPRAVPADATLFLETLVKDIYVKSNTKLKSDELPFYQKIDFLYRSGVITYIFKNKLQDAYNLRNKIHRNVKNPSEESDIALDLHQRLFYISKKYFRDFTGSESHLTIPEYRKPARNDVHFKNCIICGEKNDSIVSNMCAECNAKIDTANYIVSLKNTYRELFTKENLIDYGLTESEAISLIMNLTAENLIVKKSDYFTFNESRFKTYLGDVEEYVKISELINRFYRNEIETDEITKTIEYWKGSKNQKPCGEFFRLVNLKIEQDFEKHLIKTENIKKSKKESSISTSILKEWFKNQMQSFCDGKINDAFIIYNELLIRKYFDLKRKGLDDGEVRRNLSIDDETVSFWQNQFMGEEFLKKNSSIKKDLLLRGLSKNMSLPEAMRYAGVSQAEFERIHMISKKAEDDFYKEFEKLYTQKRKRLLLKNLKNNYLSRAIRMSKITRSEFLNWYFKGEIDESEFYIKSTSLLMRQYLELKKRGLKKSEILLKLSVSDDIVKSWGERDDLDIFKNFNIKNKEITENLVKRGLIINALKDDKSVDEALESAGMKRSEFDEIYATSVREKSDFHMRFDREYANNRKRLFVKLLKDNDFYNSLVKSCISQKEFNRWYKSNESAYLSGEATSDFYIKTTELLMDKYIQSRLCGKNRPDAARSVGLENTDISRWLKHQEFSIFRSFKARIEKLYITLIRKSFSQAKSKEEVMEECDIAVSVTDSYINKSKVGIKGYEDIYELYENVVIAKKIEVFLSEIKSKTFKKALSISGFSENELNHYYALGEKGGKYEDFHNEYLEIKKELYIKAIIAKKSHRIAFKNSQLTDEEFKSNEAEIQDVILNRRIDMICDSLEHYRKSTKHLADIAGVEIEDLYDWYIKGKSGEAKYSRFSIIFEIVQIVPRVMAINKAMAYGLSKNRLMKKLKKDLGSKEYALWQKYDIIEGFDHDISLDGDVDVDKEQVLRMLANSEFIKNARRVDDPEIFEMMKMATKGNSKVIGYFPNASKKSD